MALAPGRGFYLGYLVDFDALTGYLSCPEEEGANVTISRESNCLSIWSTLHMCNGDRKYCGYAIITLRDFGFRCG